MSLISLFSELKPHQYLKKTETGWEFSDQKRTPLAAICQDIITEANQYNCKNFIDLKKLAITYSLLREKLFVYAKKHYYLTYYVRFFNSQDRAVFEAGDKALNSLIQCCAKIWRGSLLALYNTYSYNLYNERLFDSLKKLKKAKEKLNEIKLGISEIETMEKANDRFKAEGLKRDLQKAQSMCESEIEQLKIKALEDAQVAQLCHNFLYQVVFVAMQNIKKRELCQGFVWRVRNDQGVYCYFIGSIHFATKKMSEAPLVQHATENSKKFYFETGYFMTYFTSKLFKLIPSPIFAFKYGIDVCMFEKANEKKATIVGLETFFEMTRACCFSCFDETPKKNNEATKMFIIHTNLALSLSRQFNKLSFLEDLEPETIKIYRTVKKTKTAFQNWISESIIALYSLWYEDYDEWQEGKCVQSLSGKWLLDERNKIFIKTMIDETRSARESITFTCGSAHYFWGSFPLIPELVKEFPQIERARVIEATGEMVWEAIDALNLV